MKRARLRYYLRSGTRIVVTMRTMNLLQLPYPTEALRSSEKMHSSVSQITLYAKCMLKVTHALVFYIQLPHNLL